MEDGGARHSEPRVPRTCLSKQRCLRTSSRPRRYALAPPPPLGRSPARPPSLREIFEATPDWASYKRGMRSPRTPRARASRLDRALTSPPRSNTQAIQAAKGYVHFRGSSLVRLPRPRFTGGLEQNPLARDARPRLVESTWLALRTRKRAERAFRQKKKTRRACRAPPDRRFPSPFAAGHRDVHDHPHGLRRGRPHAPGEGHR